MACWISPSCSSPLEMVHFTLSPCMAWPFPALLISPFEAKRYVLLPGSENYCPDPACVIYFGQPAVAKWWHAAAPDAFPFFPDTTYFPSPTSRSNCRAGPLLLRNERQKPSKQLHSSKCCVKIEKILVLCKSTRRGRWTDIALAAEGGGGRSDCTASWPRISRCSFRYLK